MLGLEIEASCQGDWEYAVQHEANNSSEPLRDEAEAASSAEDLAGEPVSDAGNVPADGDAPSSDEVHGEPEAASDDVAEEAKKSGASRSTKRTRSKRSEAAETEEVAVEKSPNMDWYILKVQSNREDSIREGLLRRVKIAGLEHFFGDVIVPIEKVTEFKAGKKRVVKRKLYPGYIVVQMEITEETWFLVRETPGIGDFTGAAGRPTPMLPHEVARIVSRAESKGEEQPELKIGFAIGDRVKINQGNFENFEGTVEAIDKANGRVTVVITIFGRSTPVEFEYWQVESA